LRRQAYSDDLRERVAAAYAVAGASSAQVAARFQVSASFVRKVRRQQKQRGTTARQRARPGPAPCLLAPALAELQACLAQQPDATLAELGIWLAALGQPAVSRATLGRAVVGLDWRRKKKHPCRRARHGVGRSPARGLPRVYSKRGFYPL